MSEHVFYKSGSPGPRRAPCLGCGERVVTARDPHVAIGGTRDGSLLIVIAAQPQMSYTTDPARLFAERELYLLGVAHRECVRLARQRLEAQKVELPEVLAPLRVDEDDNPLPQLQRPPEPGFCPFCGSADASDEHVFPRWVSRELARYGPFKETTEHGTRTFPTLEITVPVCTECNNRWLSVLERDVQPVLAPLIHGEERELEAREQLALATWAVKTAMMLDLAVGDPIIPTGFFHAFSQQRSPLPSHVVWLGAYMGNRRAIWSERQPLHIGIPPGESPNGFVTTFTVFRVLFQVMGHFTRGNATLNDTRLVSAGLWPIAPTQHEAIAWPRQRFAFGDEGLSDLARSVTSGEADSGTSMPPAN